MQAFFQFLEENQIPYTRHDHPAVYTVEEADRLVPELSAAKTKNLFLNVATTQEHHSPARQDPPDDSPAPANV